MSEALPPVDPAAATMPPPVPEATQTIPILTEAPSDTDPARKAHVAKILANIRRGEVHWQKDFERMRDDADFASGLQYADQKQYEDDRYRLNLVLRHIMLRVAALYAKNPKAVYKRKPKMDFAIWDEKPESILMAQQQVQMAMQAAAAQQPMIDAETGVVIPPNPLSLVPPATLRLLRDYEEGMAERQRAERLGRTLELLWTWFVSEPTPRVKMQMKGAVRRAITCGVAYAKMGFQRLMHQRPDQVTRIADLSQQLATIERLRERVMGDNPEACDYDADVEELRQALMALQSQPEVVLREGPVLDFPRATSIIPDPATRSLRGWIGTGWIAEKFELPTSIVEQIYHVRLSGKTTVPNAGMVAAAVRTADADNNVVFYQYYELATQRLYTVAEGWHDYLEEPRAPDAEVEGFFPYYVIAFNEIDHEKRIFPLSDVELLRSPQVEYNRLREGLRMHRFANRPLYVSPNGAFDKSDKVNLSEYGAHDVVQLNNLKEGQNAAELLQPVLKVPIDPALYEVEGLFADTQRATGSQEANIGGTSGATATETSVAESSRMSGLASAGDDLDETLTDIARDFGQVCLMRMDADFVKRIVGRGAVWPTMSREDILAEGALEVRAGSSGRPNRERDLANFERIAPFLLQMPGIKAEMLTEHMLRLVDDTIDLATFMAPGAPSISAQNGMQQAQANSATGDPATDPAQQGARGAQNAPATDVRPGGPQPAYGPSGNAVG